MQGLSAEQINAKLKLKLKDIADVLAAQAPFLRGEPGVATTATQMLQAVIRGAAQKNIPSVLPINTTHQVVGERSIEVGTHWTLLVVFPNPTHPKKPTIYYIDSTGNDDDLKLDFEVPRIDTFVLQQKAPHWQSAIADIVSCIEGVEPGFQPTIWVSGKVQQETDDPLSCGAWTVQNAVDMVTSSVAGQHRLRSLRDALDAEYVQMLERSLYVDDVPAAAASAASPVSRNFSSRASSTLYAAQALTSQPAVAPATSVFRGEFSDISLNSDISFIRLFEEVATQYASRIAVQLYGQQYTYQQINDAANALAVDLHQKFPRGTLIGLVLDRDQNLIIAMLAIWKAGLGFTPMDPKSAKGVFEFWVKDSEIKAIITNQCPERLAQVIREQKVTQISMETFSSTKLTPAQLAALTPVTLEDTAYVMYTSGSTGQPKGVKILHRGLPHCLRAHDKVLDRIALQDVVAQFSSITFDAIIIEIMMALGRGAKLLMVPLAVREDLQQLTIYYAEHGVTIAILTPEQLKRLDVSNFPQLRALFIVGEAFPQSLSDRWISENRMVFNGYGLTETTIALTLKKLQKGKALTIGQVIEGLFIELRRLTEAERDDKTAESPLIAGQDMIPVSDVNVEGELVVFGPSLTPGYHGARGAALNSERFFWLDHLVHGRVWAYRTGDIGAYVESGDLVLLGRLGREIKLRAQRIHPGVIENKILECQYQGKSLIQQVCLVAKKDQRGETRLVAYVALNSACELNEKVALIELHRLLKESLPLFAVPAFSHIIPVLAEQFNAFKKSTDKENLDIKTITTSWLWPRQHRIDSIPPENEVEESLRKIWFEILEIPDDILSQLGVNEDFFDWGGDSLKFESLKLALGKAFPNIDWCTWVPATIGEFTIRSIATHIIEESRNDVLLQLVEGNRERLYMVHALTGDPSQDYQHFKPLAMTAHYLLLGLKPPRLKYMPTTFQALAAIYVKRILRSHPERTMIHLAGWSTGGVIALEMGKQLRAQGRQVNLFVLDSFCPSHSHFKSFESQPALLLAELERMKRKFAEIVAMILHISSDELLLKWNALYHDIGKGLLHAVDAWFESTVNVLEQMPPSVERNDAIERLRTIKGIFLLELNYGLSLNAQEMPPFMLFSARTTRETYDASLGWPKSLVARHTPFDGDHFSLVSSAKAAEIFSHIRTQINRLSSRTYCEERKDIAQELELYVPPLSCDQDAKPESSETQQLPFLTDTVVEFFRSEKKVLLLKGGPGSGKTLFGIYLERECQLGRLNLPDDAVVFFVSLPSLENPVDDLMQEYFKRKKDNDEAEATQTIKELKVRQHVYFVLDAYDEIPAFQQNPTAARNLYNTNHLNEWREAKFVISCRSSFLERISAVGVDARRYFAPAGLDLSGYRSLQVVQVAMFNQGQLDRYIDQYLACPRNSSSTVEESRWTSTEYRRHIQALPNIARLVRTPLLLKMTIEALPIIVAWHTAQVQRNLRVDFKERDIFIAYLKYNVLRQADRLAETQVQSEDGAVEKDFLAFLIELSVHMVANRVLNVEYYFRPHEFDEELVHEGPEWAKRFFGDPWRNANDERKVEKLQRLEVTRNNLTCLLVYQDGKWGFIHDSFREWLNTINQVELAKIRSRLRMPDDKQARAKAMREFARILFKEPTGPYYLTQPDEYTLVQAQCRSILLAAPRMPNAASPPRDPADAPGLAP